MTFGHMISLSSASHEDLMASSTALLNSLGQVNKMRKNMNFGSCDTFCWHCITCQLLSSMVPLHSLGHDDQNEVHPDFFGHVMPLASILA